MAVRHISDVLIRVTVNTVARVVVGTGVRYAIPGGITGETDLVLRSR